MYVHYKRDNTFFCPDIPATLLTVSEAIQPRATATRSTPSPTPPSSAMHPPPVAVETLACRRRRPLPRGLTAPTFSNLSAVILCRAAALAVALLFRLRTRPTALAAVITPVAGQSRSRRDPNRALASSAGPPTTFGRSRATRRKCGKAPTPMTRQRRRGHSRVLAAAPQSAARRQLRSLGRRRMLSVAE